jgi:GTPase
MYNEPQMTMQFIIFDIVPPHTTIYEKSKRVEETKNLINTLTDGHGVISHIVQQRTHPNLNTYMGSGKIEEIKELIKSKKIYIVLNDIVKPTQVHELFMTFWESNPQIVVWDRVDLILQIFRKNAHTAQSKLQIELASMRHMGPRIFGMGMIMSRQGGGVGTRGIGETNTERMKRYWRSEIAKTEKKLTKLCADQKTRISKRQEKGVVTVALVGYTNAGKTSLFNALTGKSKLSKDMLFATLDSATGFVLSKYLNHHDSVKKLQKILVTDTIGFMHGLPPQLIKAFASTLTETVFADCIVHVADSSDANLDEKMSIVTQTLKDINVSDDKVLTVLNKSDLPPQISLEEVKYLIKSKNAILTSSTDTQSLKNLLSEIVTRIS